MSDPPQPLPPPQQPEAALPGISPEIMAALQQLVRDQQKDLHKQLKETIPTEILSQYTKVKGLKHEEVELVERSSLPEVIAEYPPWKSQRAHHAKSAMMSLLVQQTSIPTFDSATFSQMKQHEKTKELITPLRNAMKDFANIYDAVCQLNHADTDQKVKEAEKALAIIVIDSMNRTWCDYENLARISHGMPEVKYTDDKFSQPINELEKTLEIKREEIKKEKELKKATKSYKRPSYNRDRSYSRGSRDQYYDRHDEDRGRYDDERSNRRDNRRSQDRDRDDRRSSDGRGGSPGRGSRRGGHGRRG